MAQRAERRRTASFRQVARFFVENLRRVNLALEIDDALERRIGHGAWLSSCSRAAVRACDRRLGSRASAMKFMLTGFPVSGSTSAKPPSFNANCGVGFVTYFKFAAMRGRRNTDTAGWALCSP